MFDSIETEEVELPIYQSPELAQVLLEIEAHELTQGDEHPEDALIHKARALQNWHLSGHRPRYILNRWIEVVITGNLQGFCRILNARTHQALSPLNLAELIKQVNVLSNQVDRLQSTPDFVVRLLAAYDEYPTGQAVKFEDLYRDLRARQPDYSREQFGFDMADLQEYDSLHDRVLTLSLSQKRAPGRFFLPRLDGQGLIEWDQLQLSESLQALDI